jgi:hypothetical protein
LSSINEKWCLARTRPAVPEMKISDSASDVVVFWRVRRDKLPPSLMKSNDDQGEWELRVAATFSWANKRYCFRQEEVGTDCSLVS